MITLREVSLLKRYQKVFKNVFVKLFKGVMKDFIKRKIDKIDIIFVK